MATSEELFMSIDPVSYRQSKSFILMGEIEVLHTLKRLQNLRVLSRQKSDLKKRLQKLLLSTLTQVESLQSIMPTPAVPKNIRKKEEPKRIIGVQISNQKRVLSKSEEIEEELKMIKEKLKQLNS